MASTVIVAGALFPYNPSSMEGLKKLHFRPYNGNGGNRGNVKTALASPASARACRLMVRAEAINPGIRKEEAKVVDSVVASELAKPLTAYCRCWRSGTFPLCDGSHVKHNKETGDNVGPLLLKKQ